MNKWWSAVLVVVGLFLVAVTFSGLFLDSSDISGDSIVVVPLQGVITTSGDGSLFSEQGISSTKVVKKIKELQEDDLVKGIIFEIDSPGGAVVPSKEIGDAIKELDKPNYAVIRSVGASGGYWIASSTDRVFASEMSITGSIGVIGGYLQFEELFNKYGVGYERFVGGEFKDIGTPYRSLDDEERRIFQSKINLIHEFFIKEVASNREMSFDETKKLATGEIYLGVEAKELGLIDEFGNKEVAIEAMKEEVGDLEVVYLEKELSFFELLSSVSAYHFGRGFASELSKIELENSYSFEV